MNKPHTLEQIVRTLRQAETKRAATITLPEVARAWYQRGRLLSLKNHYGGMHTNSMRRLREREKENARLKKKIRRSGSGHQHLQRVELRKRLSIKQGSEALPST